MQVKAALTAYLQNADLYQRLKKDSAQASGEIVKDLADRRDASKQIWSEVGQQWNDAMRSIGDALRPVTDAVGHAAKATGEGLAKITDAAPKTTMAVAGVAAGFIAYRGAKSLFQIGRGALDIARGSILAGRAGAASGGGKVGAVARVAEALGGAVGGVQRVFVVNLPGGAGGLGGAVGAIAGELGDVAAGGARGAGKGGRVARVLRGARGLIGRVMPYASKLAAAGTVLKIGMAATNAWGVATSDGNRAEKAKGFAGIAGSLAGGVLGAKTGAIIGAAAGPIGIAIGGLVGGAIGAYAGEKALGAVTKWAFSRGDAHPAVDAVAKAKGLEKAGGADRPVTKVDQRNTFAPVFHVTLQGDGGSSGSNGNDAADRFLAKVSPQLQRMMKDQIAKSNRSAMFDSPHL